MLTETPPIEEAIRDLVHGSVASHGGRWRLHKVLFEDTPIPPELEEGLSQVARRGALVLAGYFRRAPDVAVEDRELASHLVIECLTSLVHRFVIDPPEGWDPEACEEELVRLVTCYVKAPAPAPA